MVLKGTEINIVSAHNLTRKHYTCLWAREYEFQDVEKDYGNFAQYTFYEVTAEAED